MEDEDEDEDEDVDLDEMASGLMPKVGSCELFTQIRLSILLLNLSTAEMLATLPS